MDPRRALLQFSVVLALIVVAVGFLFLRQRVPPVSARFDPLPTELGLDPTLHLELRAARGGIRHVRLQLVQPDREVTLYEASFDSSKINERSLNIQVKPRTQGAEEGDGRLEVWASDGFWRPRAVDDEPVLSLPVRVDLTPPEVEIVSFTRYLSQGGSGVAVLRSRDAERCGITVGNHFHPASPQGDAAQGLQVALFAIPFDHPVGEKPVAECRDAAGNRTRKTLEVVIAARDFPHGKVTLQREFLARKLPELLPQRGEIPPKQYGEAFRYVSTVIRARAESTFVALSKESVPRPLWHGAFRQPPNTRVLSNFAETRDYSYEGVALDTKVHSGFDLASTRQAPVPAAGAGRVAFTGELGIYGNTVVLDHGLGLLTVYGHLSRIDVTQGQEVEQGQILGRTGATGLAVGDHLHYEVLVGGVPVNPLEWWDPRWIDGKIRQVLEEAGLQPGI